MTYDIVSKTSTNALIDSVNARLKEGWELVGQPFVHSSGWISQCMILKEKTE